MPNLADSVLEAGGKVYARAASTDKFSEVLSVDSSGYLVTSKGLTGLKIGSDFVTRPPVGQQKMTGGTTALGGTNPTAVATGLTTVTYFACALQGTTAPGVGTSVLTVGAKSGASVNVYAWKVTSNANPTLIASTGTENFDWVAVGT